MYLRASPEGWHLGPLPLDGLRPSRLQGGGLSPHAGREQRLALADRLSESVEPARPGDPRGQGSSTSGGVVGGSPQAEGWPSNGFVPALGAFTGTKILWMRKVKLRPWGPGGQSRLPAQAFLSPDTRDPSSCLPPAPGRPQARPAAQRRWPRPRDKAQTHRGT